MNTQNILTTRTNKLFILLNSTLAFLLILWVSGNSAFAANGVYVKNGLAISGYDTVAYFTQSKAVKGKKEFTAEHQGNKWRFSSAENKQAFVANPTAYLPQYGGFCAYAASNNEIAKIDPRAWTIDNNKLYLNYNKKIRKTWLKKKIVRITDADRNWPELVKKTY